MPSKDSWGGPIASEPPFVEALRKSGASVTEEVFVYGDKDKPTPLFERVKRVLTTAFRFRKLLKAKDFNLIHLNTAFDLKTILRDSISLFLMDTEKAKIFLKIHGSEAEKFEKANFFVRFLIDYLKRKVDAFGVFTTEELANFLQLGFDEKRFYFVKNVVTIQENLDENFVREQKEKGDFFELLFVSRFIATKGLIETIRACAIVKERNHKFLLHCVGDGETRAEAEREVEKLNLQSFVKFAGYIPEREVTEYFFEKDILIFPTRHIEGFPLVIFKAVAVGMPIVTTKIRAAADYLREPENCLFCTQSPENIAERIIELIENKELRKQMSKNNRNFGEKLLPGAVSEEYLEIYRKVLQK